jgi:hypothetical protein
VQTFGDLVNFHPHVHVLATDGAFRADGTFVALPAIPQGLLVEGFRRAHRLGQLRLTDRSVAQSRLTALGVRRDKAALFQWV